MGLTASLPGVLSREVEALPGAPNGMSPWFSSLWRCGPPLCSCSSQASENTVRFGRVYSRVRAILQYDNIEEPWDFREVLPAWAYAEEVKALTQQKEFSQGEIPMGVCVGPAVFWARVAVAVHWLGAFAMFLVGLSCSTCTSDGLVIFPLWIWALWVPIALVGNCLELRCFKYTTIPYIQVMREFRTCCRPVSYTFWTMIMLAQSNMNRLDAVTDGFFAAEMIAECRYNSDRIEGLGRLLLSRSPLAPLSCLSIASQVKLSYTLLALQFIYPILQSTPRCNERADYIVGNKTSTGAPATLKFISLAGEEMNLGDTLMILADSAGMATVSGQSPEFPRRKERLRRERDPQPQQSLTFVRNALSRGVLRIGLVGLLENVFQINLQVTMFLIRHQLTGLYLAHPRALMSISLSILMLLGKIWEGIVLLRFSSEVRHAVEPARQKLREGQGGRPSALWAVLGLGQRAPGGAQQPGAVKGWCIEQEHQAVMRYTAALAVMLVPLALMTLYAGATLSISYFCKDAIWSMGTCLDLTDLPNNGGAKQAL